MRPTAVEGKGGSQAATSSGSERISGARQIRQIGHDAIDAHVALGQRCQKVADGEVHSIAKAVRAHVVPRHRERGGRTVEGQDPKPGHAGCERTGDGAAPRADIGDERVGPLSQDLDRPLHEPLGLRARDQHGGTDGQAQALELLEPEEVLERLAGRPPPEESEIAPRLVGRQLPCGVR